MQQIKDRIIEILRLEQESIIDWKRVQEKSLAALAIINQENLYGGMNSTLYQYLEDVDIRSKDFLYADHQRRAVRAILDNGPDHNT